MNQSNLQILLILCDLQKDIIEIESQTRMKDKKSDAGGRAFCCSCHFSKTESGLLD